MFMKKNKYLDELGIPVDEQGCNFVKSSSFKRRIRWFKQRKNYGFDDRETWDMDHNYIEWLYCHLRMYHDVTNTDMDQTVLTDVVVGKDKVIKEITMSDAYQFMVDILGDYLKEDFLAIPSEEVYEALHMFASTFRAWWW